MSSPVSIRVTHRYSAPADRVFDAWLTPPMAARFLFRTRTGNVMHCEIQPEVGGGFTITDRRPAADGDESVFDVVHIGKYLEIERPRRIVFDLSVGTYEENSRVTVEVASLGPSASEVTLTHDLPAGVMGHAMAEPTRKGWTTTLAMMERELFPRRIGVSL